MSDYKSNNEYLKEIAGDESEQHHTNNEYLKEIANKCTCSTEDMNEGDPLASGHFYAVYEADEE